MIRTARPARRALIGCAVSVAVLVGVPVPAAADHPSGTISPANRELAWQGPMYVAAANTTSSTAGCVDASGQPRATSVTTGPGACDVFPLHVAVDHDDVRDSAHRVVVTVTAGPADDFDVVVFESNDDGTVGTFVGGSGELPGATERVVFDTAPGDYYVLVVGFAVAASSYHGAARLASTDLAMHGQARGVSSYLHDVSEPDPEITLQNAVVAQHRVAVADGIELDTWVLRPDPRRLPDPVPVVLTITPYYGGGNPMETFPDHIGLARELVPRGYAYGIVSIRGTGNSSGCFSIGGPSEAKDSAIVIDYYANLPWSNGNVGLIGLSYEATTAQDVWVEAPSSLATIMPVAPISDLYKYNFINAVPIMPQGFAFNIYYWVDTGLWPAGLAGGEQTRDPVRVPGAIAGEVCAERVWVTEGGASSTADGNKDGYWQQRDFLTELDAAPGRDRASVFYVHGLADWNVTPHHMADWLPAMQATGVPFKAWLGQWTHDYPDRDDWWLVLTAWLDQFLKDRETGILNAPPVQVETAVGADQLGKWRHEREWPPATRKRLALYPQRDGSLGAAPGAETASYYDYNGRLATQEEQAIHGPDRAVFVSAPLTKERVLSGQPRFEGTVTVSGDRASLMLTLLEIAPDGTTRSLNHAALSLNHATDLAHGKASVAGVPQRITVDFFPQDDIVAPGSRIALIAAGDIVIDNALGPDLQPVADGSTITLDLSDARLSLPHDNTISYERP